MSIKVKVPSSKSQTIRALAFACFAEGESTIFDPLISPDIDAMILAIEQMGASVEVRSNSLIVKPNAFQISEKLFIDSGNSGLVLRFMTALFGLKSCSLEVTGDLSIQKRRPIKPLISALEQLGVKFEYLSSYEHPPFVIKGPIKNGIVEIDGMDSQPISALLMALSFLNDKSIIHVKNPGEKPWVDLTLHWIRKLGGEISNENYGKYVVFGNLKYAGFKYRVPGDFSSAAFPIAAAIITESYCEIENLFFDDHQGDKKLIDLLIQIGAKIEKDEQNRRLIIYPSKKLKGGVFDVNDIIDAVPILAVIGCFCESDLELKNCQIARFKESNRLESITSELQKMGANIKATNDSILIKPSDLKATSVKSYDDHRIAMALCVASLKAKGSGFFLDNGKCIKKTYSNFFHDLGKFKKV